MLAPQTHKHPKSSWLHTVEAKQQLTWLWTNLWFVLLETCFWQISQNPELLPGFGEGTGVVRPSRERVELRSIAAIKVVQGLGIDGFEAFRNG